MAQKGPNGESSYQNVKVDVAVDVANAVGGVTSVIARITLLEILDDNTVGENFKATVVGVCVLCSRWPRTRTWQSLLRHRRTFPAPPQNRVPQAPERWLSTIWPHPLRCLPRIHSCQRLPYPRSTNTNPNTTFSSISLSIILLNPKSSAEPKLTTNDYFSDTNQ